MSEGSHRSAPVGAASTLSGSAAGPAGIAVVVPHAVVLLPAGIAPHVVEAVWGIVADPAVQAESLVGALPLRGHDEVRSFALVVHEGAGMDGTRLQVVLRGEAVIDVDVVVDGRPDARRVDARQAAPFYLATLDRVTAYRVALSDGAATTRLPAGLPLVAGVVASDGVAWDRTEHALHALPALPRGPGLPTAPALPAEPLEPAGKAARPRRTGTHALPDAVTDAEPVGRPAGAGRGARRAAGGADGSQTEAHAAARARSASVPTAAIPTAATPTAAGDDAQEDDEPRTVHAFRIVRSGAAGAADADPPPERIPLDVPAIVGRRPRPPRVVRGAAPRLVAVPSPLGEISSTHVGLRQESGAIVVTDLDSTNGTAVLAPGADRLALRPGESLVVVPGTRIDIGDGVVLEILSAR